MKKINITPEILANIITKQSKYCYFIESQYQRPFVWTFNVILNDFINVVYSFLLKRLDDEYYEYTYDTMGSSPIEEVNRKYVSPKFVDCILSILDGGHRIRLFMCLYIVLLLLKYREEDKEYLNIDDYIKVTNGEYKLDGIGLLKDDFKGFYSFINNTKIKDILKTKDKNFKPDRIKSLFSRDSTTCEKSMKEVFYFLLYSIQGYYKNDGIDALPEEVSYDFTIDAILKGIIFHNEDVPYDYKWEYFRNKNGRGMPLADKYLYSRQLINTIQDDDLRNSVNLLFIKFDEKCKSLEEKPDYLTEYKDIMTYIMSEIYKLFLYEHKIIKYTAKKINIFSDSRLGLNVAQGKYKVLIDGEEIDRYFKLCDKFASFLQNTLGYTNGDLYKTNYLFYDFSRKKNVVLWSVMAPSVFIMREFYSNDENMEKFIFKSILHYMLLYYLDNYLLPGSGVEWFHNGVSELNNIIYTNRNNNVEETKVKIISFLKNDFTSRDKSQIMNVINTSCTLGVSISEKGKDAKGGYPIAMRIIPLYFEALFIDKVDIKGNRSLNDYFEKISNTGKNGYDLDHIFTKKKYNDELKLYDKTINSDNDFDKSKIGNFVFLEQNLNRTKGDDESKNANVYSQSLFYTTKLLNKNNKCDLSNEKLGLIPFKRYSEEELNNPSVSFVEERTKDISYIFVNWVFSFYEENKKLINNNIDEYTIVSENKALTTETVFSE